VCGVAGCLVGPRAGFARRTERGALCVGFAQPLREAARQAADRFGALGGQVMLLADVVPDVVEAQPACLPGIDQVVVALEVEELRPTRPSMTDCLKWTPCTTSIFVF